jgi:hypothetical protein
MAIRAPSCDLQNLMCCSNLGMTASGSPHPDHSAFAVKVSHGPWSGGWQRRVNGSI